MGWHYLYVFACIFVTCWDACTGNILGTIVGVIVSTAQIIALEAVRDANEVLKEAREKFDADLRALFQGKP